MAGVTSPAYTSRPSEKGVKAPEARADQVINSSESFNRRKRRGRQQIAGDTELKGGCLERYVGCVIPVAVEEPVEVLC